MFIHFSDTAATCSPKGSVVFVAMVDATEVNCEVSPEALADHFGAKRMDPPCLLAAFEAHRREILATAAAMLPHRLSGRRCLLFSRDFSSTLTPGPHVMLEARSPSHPGPIGLPCEPASPRANARSRASP
ncbi:hypothetical protein PUN4_280155 [Paraburkholderia unamae]|uniref:DUF1488 domain-containing protein n=1 Tax=Paraburkholderia unamae TaxID=219649 RepID=UPI001CB19469|nr:DUF1488 domain-containing protein [Paraburkholderia unamae]CAG9257228.1 hypothetical protein PUN4_280155 [Paraburkholderia unamae]